MKLHNNITDITIREENELYNKTWIKTNNLMFSNTVSVNQFKNESPSKVDSSPMIVVWLKNIDKLLELIPKSYNLHNYHLLDIGCGSGISTIYFRKRFKFKSYSGIDFEKKFIDQSKLNTLKMSINDIRFIIDDVTNLLLDDKPNFLFLFNPFGLKTMKSFFLNNIENLKINKSIIGYVNDIHIDYFEKYDTQIIRNDYYNISMILF